MQFFRFQFWLIRLLAMLLFPMLLAACPMRPQVDDPAVAEEIENPPVPLEVGQATIFEFAPDGLWHDSPVLAHNGHRLRITPDESAQGLSAQAIRFKIDQVPQMLKGGVTLDVTMPGRLGFRTESLFLGEHQGPVSVRIERLK